MNLLKAVQERFRPVLADLTDDVDASLAMIRVAQDSKFGDFQANFAMPLAKKLGRAPRELAEEAAAAAVLEDLCDAPEVAGPGFINLRIRNDVLVDRISAAATDERLGVAGPTTPRKVIIDFSSPNVAKPMHVGHLRSTVIGDCLSRTLRFAGHDVLTDNHIGDWGTQFGMIIYGYRHFVDSDAYAQDPVAELARLYKLVNQLSDYHAAIRALPEYQEKLIAAEQRVQTLEAEEAEREHKDKQAKKKLKAARKECETLREKIKSASEKTQAVDESDSLQSAAAGHPEIARLAREETAKLHAGDEANLALWNEFLPACLEALNHVYRRLGIQFDRTLGESYYQPWLGEVADELTEAGLAAESEGALCVFLEGNDAPFIIRKTDGAFTYATTDLATIRYRADELKADEVLYVVDARQSEHFQMLFRTAGQWKYGDLSCRHVSFGTVMGPDGKPYKTRAGDAVGLESLLDEAVSRARTLVDANDDRRDEPLLDETARSQAAEAVGLGGVKYADLHHNRESDYIFDWDKMLATTGDTAAYMQYAHARINGIFRKLNVDRDQHRSAGHRVLLEDPAERRLAFCLAMFPHAVEAVLQEYRPHQLTLWLFETANAFSSFYDQCPVKDAPSEQVRNSRLLLCDLMARGLRTGLELLGIATPEIM